MLPKELLPSPAWCGDNSQPLEACQNILQLQCPRQHVQLKQKDAKRSEAKKKPNQHRITAQKDKAMVLSNNLCLYYFIATVGSARENI